MAEFEAEVKKVVKKRTYNAWQTCKGKGCWFSREFPPLAWWCDAKLCTVNSEEAFLYFRSAGHVIGNKIIHLCRRNLSL